MSDERTAAELRELARAVTPTMSLDPERTVALGRRRRRRGQVLIGGGAVAGTGLVLAAAVALGGSPWAPVVQQPYTIGDAQVVELAPGVRAANGVTAQESATGRAWWDTGLPVDDRGAVLHVGLGFDDSSDPAAGILVGGFDVADGAESPWLGTVFDGTGELRWDAVLAGDDTSWRVLVGELPAGASAAVLYLRVGTAGSPVGVRLPLFTDPIRADRLLYAALVEFPGAAEDAADVLFVAGDGSIREATTTCGDGVTAACLASQPDGGLVLADALRAAGADVPATTPATVVALAAGLDAVVGPVDLDGFQTDLGTLAGARVVLDRFTRSAGTDPEVVQLAAFRDGEHTGGTPQDLVLGDGYAVIVAAMAGGARVEAGVLPTGSDGTRVIAWSDASGELRVIEVPTFTFPVPGTDEPERLFYALGLAPDTEWRSSRIAFLDTDGTLTDTECAAPDPGACLPDELGDAVAELGGD